MQWDDSPNAGFSEVKPYSELVKGKLGHQNINVASQINDPNSLFNSIKRMIAIRKKHDAFGSSGMEWIETGNPHVAAYIRQHGEDIMLILNNLSRSTQIVKLPLQYQNTYLDLFAGHMHIISNELMLEPYSHLWLQMKK